MKNYHLTVRSSMLLPFSMLAGAVLISGIFLYNRSNTRQYSPLAKVENVERDNDARGMAQFFFNARKNPLTGIMDYSAMAQAESEVAKIKASQSTMRTMGGLGLKWKGMGPSNVGGRTRAILIDKNDASGNTIFAGGVSGGLWVSKNAGVTWDSINDNLPSLEVSCIAQDINGNIYIGTGEGFSVYSVGEGFSTGMLGGGIFKSTDDGKTFNLLPSTVPASNKVNTPWAYVHRIAISSCNPNVIYAAVYGGLMVSPDAGSTWYYARNSVTNKQLNNSSIYGGDVKISLDGSVIVADLNGVGYISYPNCSSPFDTLFTQISSAKIGGIPTSNRIEFAISPTNSNYIYASVASNSGVPAKGFIGIYMSMNQGKYWYLIGPGGSLAFDPYAEPGGSSPDQATYDNTMAVSPANSGYLLVGGTTLWSWQQKNASDTVGFWTSISHYSPIGAGDPLYIHPDEHAIVFDPNHPTIVYLGCDGGIYKSSTNGASWAATNRDYNVTQFYTLDFAPYVNPVNGEGIIGGTQDNGTPYIDGTSSPYYEDENIDMSGGDGGNAAISSINPNTFFTSIDYGSEFNRGSSLNTYGLPGSFYTTLEGLNKGANIDSVAGIGTGCFVFPIALYENMYDNNTIDSIRWIADKKHNAGDTVYPISPNGNVAYPYILPASVAKAGDSVMVKNTVVSKIAVGFTPSNGVWMCMQAADLADPAIWMPIGGPKSLPDAFNGGAYPIHCMAWSPDGDALFVGTEDGQFYRFSNLNKVRDTSYTTGALFSVRKGVPGAVTNPSCVVVSKKMTTLFSATSRDILSIAIDPYDGNNLIVTLGDYTYGTNIYYVTNALSNTPVITPAQGTGLPAMPVYSSVFLLGSGDSTSAVIGTEHGVYSTRNISVATPTWVADNGGAPNTLVLAMKQQTLPMGMCNNSGNIYMGTHGRGAWYTGSIGPLAVKDVIANNSAEPGLKVYPNPMSTQGTIEFNLTKEDNITLTIYDIQGRVVKSQSMESVAVGEHLVPIHTEEFSNGTYIVTLTGSDFRKSARIVVVK